MQNAPRETHVNMLSLLPPKDISTCTKLEVRRSVALEVSIVRQQEPLRRISTCQIAVRTCFPLLYLTSCPPHRSKRVCSLRLSEIWRLLSSGSSYVRCCYPGRNGLLF